MDDFEMPPTREPEGREPNTLGDDWPDYEGSPACPVETPNGWAAGGRVKFTLCQANPQTGAVGCQHYDAGRDQCRSAMPECLRGEAVACMNYRARS